MLVLGVRVCCDEDVVLDAAAAAAYTVQYTMQSVNVRST